MARDGSGNYTKPYPDVVTNTTIASTMFNGTVNDIANDLNVARPIIAGGTGATSATAARNALAAEVAAPQQVVTNYDAQVWQSGSFSSAAGATSAPESAANYVGTAIVAAGGDTAITARNITTGVNYMRSKPAGGAWTAWAADSGAGAFVLKAGDTMTGNLKIEANYPVLTLNKLVNTNTVDLVAASLGVPRWYIRPAAGSGSNDDFIIMACDNSGTPTISSVYINRTTGLVTLAGDPTAALGVATKQYVDNVGNTKVARVGDTMTGALTLSYATPTFTLDANPSSANSTDIYMKQGGLNRWLLRGGGPPTSDFGIYNFDNTGATLGVPLAITRTTGAVTLGASLSVATTGAFGGNLDSKGAVSCTNTEPRYYYYDASSNLKAFTRFESTGNTWQVIMYPGSSVVGLTCDSNGLITAGKGWASKAGSSGATNGYDWNFSWDTVRLQTYIGNTNIGYVTITSDYRTKKDVTDLGSKWETVKALRPVSYEHTDYSPPVREGGEPEPPLFQADGVVRWGFIAHELQEALLPSAATGVKDDPKAIQSPDPWPVIATLTKALQEAMARIETLEAQYG